VVVVVVVSVVVVESVVVVVVCSVIVFVDSVKTYVVLFAVFDKRLATVAVEIFALGNISAFSTPYLQTVNRKI
jgi:hypothetical protein